MRSFGVRTYGNHTANVIVAVLVPSTDLNKQALGTSASTILALRMPNRPPRIGMVFQRYDPPLYFITFNTHRRKKLLANRYVHSRFIEFVRSGEKLGLTVGRYVIMPEHVHLFARGSYDYPLTQWIRLLKRSLSEMIRTPLPHWQKGFFDHILRNSDSYSQKWDYVFQNPVRAGLVTNPEDWPRQGEIVRLEE
jgi:REP element-mobilizing transposase RayT